jgi:hypothetical protein
MTTTKLANRPAHVATERVVEFDFYNPPGLELRIILAEWLKRIPVFSVTQGPNWIASTLTTRTVNDG